ncbi:toprim domain-containing protein [Sulfitobacter sp. D35]|nr:toprim domain-containing protein [Sulfitobacter sp. D35]MDW4497916.1 toprim domain-containing protein [Sulfitobacter sp. D35]
MESTASEIAQRLSHEAEAICRHYLSNGRKQGRYWIVGNAENSPGRSLYVLLTGPISGKGAAGKWTDAATGEHGDLLDLISANLRLSSLGEALDEARRFLSLPRPDPPPRAPQPNAPTGSPEAARRLWAMAQPIAGTLAEGYLASRGIVGMRNTSALRFHPHCYYWREHEPDDTQPEAWPALLAKVTDTGGNLTGLHRTWLDPTTAGKAPLDPNRKAMGNLLGHGVRIGKATDLVAAGEGLETMLSLRMALPDLPVIAALSANHLAALDLPDGIERLYIAVDSDKAGRFAADTLADRARSSGIETVPLAFRLEDANADLRAFGLHDLRAHLRPQLAPQDVERLLASSAA